MVALNQHPKTSITAGPMVETGSGTTDRAVSSQDPGPEQVPTKHQTGAAKSKTTTSHQPGPKAVQAAPGATETTTGAKAGAKTDAGPVVPWIEQVLEKVDAKKLQERVLPGKSSPKTEASSESKPGQAKR